MKYGKELRSLNTKGEYGKVTDTEIKWSIISKSVMIIIFVEFINQLIDYLINYARFIGWDKWGYPVNIFLISPYKHMLWVLIRSASPRRF